jgi:hypothetical protein
MTLDPQRPSYTPFDRLSDEELREAMVMHIRMGFILKNPGRSSEAEEIARDLVSRLSLDQLKEIHPQTFFANKKMGSPPKNPYLMAKEMLQEDYR